MRTNLNDLWIHAQPTNGPHEDVGPAPGGEWWHAAGHFRNPGTKRLVGTDYYSTKQPIINEMVRRIQDAADNNL